MDTADQAILKINEIYPINSKFLLVPFLAYEFPLLDLDFVLGPSDLEAFNDYLNIKFNLFTGIVNKSQENDKLIINLHGRNKDTNEMINLKDLVLLNIL